MLGDILPDFNQSNELDSLVSWGHYSYRAGF